MQETPSSSTLAKMIDTPFLSVAMSLQPPTFSRDFLPGVGWVHEGSVLDLVINVFVLVEGEGATQTHVDDDAYWPHVQRAVVAFTAQHLRSQVRRCAHYRAPKWLLSDDAGEAEITQLHLRLVWGQQGVVHVKDSSDDLRLMLKMQKIPECSPVEKALLMPEARSPASNHNVQCS